MAKELCTHSWVFKKTFQKNVIETYIVKKRLYNFVKDKEILSLPKNRLAIATQWPKRYVHIAFGPLSSKNPLV